MLESFETSEATDKLDAAMALIQGELKAADKSAENPGFKRDGKPMKYADLAAVWDSCREIIAKHGVSAMQFPVDGENPQRLYLVTRVAHAGQWIKTTFSMPVAQQTPQGVGSAITYARRYALSAALGIVSEEDDDGNAASQGGARQPANQQQRQPNQSINQSTKTEPVKLTKEQENLTAAIDLAIDASKTRMEVIEVMTKHEATIDKLPNAAEVRERGRTKIRQIAKIDAEIKERELAAAEA